MSCQKTACKYVMAVPRRTLRTVYTRLWVHMFCIQPGCVFLVLRRKEATLLRKLKNPLFSPRVSLWTNFSGCIYEEEEKCSPIDLCCVLFLCCQMQRKGRAELLKSSQGRVHIEFDVRSNAAQNNRRPPSQQKKKNPPLLLFNSRKLHKNINFPEKSPHHCSASSASLSLSLSLSLFLSPLSPSLTSLFPPPYPVHPVLPQPGPELKNRSTSKGNSLRPDCGNKVCNAKQCVSKKC